MFQFRLFILNEKKIKGDLSFFIGAENYNSLLDHSQVEMDVDDTLDHCNRNSLSKKVKNKKNQQNTMSIVRNVISGRRLNLMHRATS